MPTQFSSPGYEMSQAILQEMARRDAEEQQQFQNNVVLHREARADEHVALQREQEANVRAQQKAALDALTFEREGDRAVNIEDRMLPGVVDPKTAALLRKHDLGQGLTDQMTLPGASIPQPEGVSVGGSAPTPAIPGAVLPQEPTGVVESAGGAKWQAAEATREAARIAREENALDRKAKADADREAANQRNQDAIEGRAANAALAGGMRSDARDAARTARNDRNRLAIEAKFDSSPIVKKYVVVKEAVDFSKKALDANNPASDMGLVYHFAKSMDPDSAVREGEYGTVAKYAQTLPEKYALQLKRLFQNGEFLTPEAKTFLVKVIQEKAASSEKTYRNFRKDIGARIDRETGGSSGEKDLVDYGAAFEDDLVDMKKPTAQELIDKYSVKP